jgi:exopolyphosphatase / guanosine-5'-triphosphate,3'-diphosphate pyrophosphatase
MKRYAVIDLGSNTFHLMIVTANLKGTIEVTYRERIFVALSEGGISSIKQERIEAGKRALLSFQKTLKKYEPLTLRVVGTAVLRKAENRQVFISIAEEILATKIDIIDGSAEANYIYKGVTLLPETKIGNHLIMDIGGGSTEFIVIENGVKTFSASYMLGVGVLHQLFHHNEPILEKDILGLENYILVNVTDLLHHLKGTTISMLIGASGSFEVLESMSGQTLSKNQLTQIDKTKFDKIYSQIITLDLENRKKLKGLPVERAKLIVVGMVLKQVILNAAHITKIGVSPYALKEGILAEMIDLTSNDLKSHSIRII